jgi:hypothetical protein
MVSVSKIILLYYPQKSLLNKNSLLMYNVRYLQQRIFNQAFIKKYQ